MCNGHVTVARGRGGEGTGGSSQRSYDRWGAGGAGWEGGEEERGGGGGGGGGGWVGGGEEERAREGARKACHSVPFGPATLGPSGPPLWGRRARHFRPIGPSTLGLSGRPPLGPFGLPPGPFRPIQYKARELVTGLKKLNFRFGPAR